ncbi:hypothetical protein [Bacillus testis]|uniref:hypothetical protein n=1 Tax=Bacillus testis TaxID=1622072 RepID=UPI00067E9933|nr:hypothetical protein [Bacillus testis]
MTFPQEKVDKIEKVLKEQGALQTCEVCHNHSFRIFEKYTYIILQDEQGVEEGQREFPAITTMCENCGHFNFHNVNAIFHPDEE